MCRKASAVLSIAVLSGVFPASVNLNDIGIHAVKRIGRDFEIADSFTYEAWKAPIYTPDLHTVTSSTVQLTWFPGRAGSF
jgi:hypothetical protein